METDGTTLWHSHKYCGITTWSVLCHFSFTFFSAHFFISVPTHTHTGTENTHTERHTGPYTQIHTHRDTYTHTHRYTHTYTEAHTQVHTHTGTITYIHSLRTQSDDPLLNKRSYNTS